KTRRKRRSRCSDQMADTLQAETVEESLFFAADAKRRYRQLGDCFRFGSVRNDAARAVMRKRPGRAGGRGDGAARLESLVGQAAEDIDEEHSLAIIPIPARE